MEKRPLSLTIIGWLTIVSSAFILLTGGSPTRNSPTIEAMIAGGGLPVWTHAAVGGLGGLLGVACGLGILKGWNWARYVYIGTLIAGVAFRVATRPGYSMLVVGTVYLIVIAILLAPECRRQLVRCARGSTSRSVMAIRYLDKLIDEPAMGKAMEKILPT